MKKGNFVLQKLPLMIFELSSGQILARSGVDLKHIANIDEERNLDLSTGFKRCGLEGVGCGVACKAGIGVGYLKLYERGGLNAEYVALVGDDLAHHLFLDKAEVIANLIVSNESFLPGLGVHKVIKVTVVVGILHIFSFDISVLKLIGGVERFFGYGTGNDVLELGAYERRALSGLYMLKFNNLQDVALTVVKCNAVFKIASYYHSYLQKKKKSYFVPRNEATRSLHHILHQFSSFCNRFSLFFEKIYNFFKYNASKLAKVFKNRINVKKPVDFFLKMGYNKYICPQERGSLMIRSMTGFGRCSQAADGLDITVEVKSVNSRFLDCSVKISRAFAYLEERVKPYLQSRGISRGKVDVWIGIEVADSGAVEVSIDEGYLKGYLDALYRLRDGYGLADDISVMSVARNQEIFRVKKPEEDIERDWARVLSVLAPAVDAFLVAREREGESIAADMYKKLDIILSHVGQIETLSEESVLHYRERLAERIRDALSDNQITPDESRLLTECAIYSDKVAVDEEILRLRTHIATFRKMLEGGEPVGRKMDFLIQEMNREINTTGSKCNNAEIAQHVVEVKCELEKIREQIQNLE